MRVSFTSQFMLHARVFILLLRNEGDESLNLPQSQKEAEHFLGFVLQKLSADCAHTSNSQTKANIHKKLMGAIQLSFLWLNPFTDPSYVCLGTVLCIIVSIGNSKILSFLQLRMLELHCPHWHQIIRFVSHVQLKHISNPYVNTNKTFEINMCGSHCSERQTRLCY